MSFHVQNYLWPITMGNPTRKSVAIALAHFADDFGANAYPSQSTLVERTELGIQTVRRGLRYLIETDIIAVSRHPNQRASTCYVFILPPGWTSFRPSGQAPLHGARPTSVALRGATVAPSDLPAWHPIDQETSIERESTTSTPPVDIERARRKRDLDGIRAALRANDPSVTLRAPR